MCGVATCASVGVMVKVIVEYRCSLARFSSYSFDFAEEISAGEQSPSDIQQHFRTSVYSSSNKQT